ncbi:MAG: polysaccharide biosynthesis protein [Halanaerobium sp.]|nr:polysaccharide biosynthesis protein [Halanaerobium sp.]
MDKQFEGKDWFDLSEGTGKLVRGAAILTAAGLISRVMGFVAKVIISRILGSEGMGLFSMSYSIYVFLLVISRSGIPVALAKLVSERLALGEEDDAFEIFRVARLLSLIFGLIFSILMIIVARPFISWRNLDPRSYLAVVGIAPAIFFVSLIAVFRGFFQGWQNMKPTALSQVVEQLIRIMTMILLVLLLIPMGLEYGALGAAFGAVTGAIAGLLVLLRIYYKQKVNLSFKKLLPGRKERFWEISKRIFDLGWPVTFAALVYPLMRFVDLAIVPERLEVAGFSNSTALFGNLDMAMTLVNFPTIFTVALAASLVPAISESYSLARGQEIFRKTTTAIKMTLLIGLPAGLGLLILAKPLAMVIFAIPEVAAPLQVLAFGVLFISLQQTTSAILQGMGKTLIPARNLFLGAVLNGIINYTLTALPQFGIRGAALGTITGFFIAASLNMITIVRSIEGRLAWPRIAGMPLLASLIMAGVVYGIHSIFLSIMSELLAAPLAVLVGVIVYGLQILLMGLLTPAELRNIPIAGKYLVRFSTRK